LPYPQRPGAAAGGRGGEIVDRKARVVVFIGLRSREASWTAAVLCRLCCTFRGNDTVSLDRAQRGHAPTDPRFAGRSYYGSNSRLTFPLASDQRNAPVPNMALLVGWKRAP